MNPVQHVFTGKKNSSHALHFSLQRIENLIKKR